MSIRNRILVVALSLLMCLSTFVPEALAASSKGEQQIMPCMEYINRAECDISIASGVASVYAYVRGTSNTATKCEITVELQEKGLLFWNTVETWSCSTNSWQTELDESSAVVSGKNYRAVAEVTVWSGTQSETRTLTSETVKAE